MFRAQVRDRLPPAVANQAGLIQGFWQCTAVSRRIGLMQPEIESGMKRFIAMRIFCSALCFRRGMYGMRFRQAPEQDARRGVLFARC